MNRLFNLRGTLDGRTRLILEIIGILLLILVWYLITMGEDPIVRSGILPRPWAVLTSYSELYFDNDLFKNLCRSLGLNLAGYTESLAIAVPLGFLIGLFPLFRGTLQKQVDAFRFVPLTAVTGLFIIWFGLGTSMKVHFLAFGILIYLLPVVVQRIDDVEDVYTKTVYTLGATNWQTIKSVYIPATISKLSDDIRVLTAISWTYIIIAESLGNEGGIGALIWRVGQRQGRVDKVFALLVIIVIIGFLQDKYFTYLDRQFFPYKYQTKDGYKKDAPDASVSTAIWSFASNVLVYAGLGIYILLFINQFTQTLVLGNEGEPILSYLFGETVRVIHFYVFLALVYKGYWLLKNKGVI
ncbi:MAG: ABC transporter permease subunit [Chitinophagales bacterium]